jgi:hypothetical protein
MKEVRMSRTETQRLETEKNRKENPRLDQDIHFVVSGIEFFLQLDTTYLGPEDMYILSSKEKWDTKGFWCSKCHGSVPQLSPEHHSGFCTGCNCKMELLEGDDVRLHTPATKEINARNKWAFAYIEMTLCDVSERGDRYTVWNHPEKGLMRVVVDSDSDLNVTQGIFASLPDWNGDDFGFIGSQTLTEFLQDIEETEKFDKDRGFFRSDGSRIVPGEVKEALFKDPFKDDDLDI